MDTASCHRSIVQIGNIKYIELIKKNASNRFPLFLLTIESTIENVNASIEATRARFNIIKIESSPNDNHVNVNTIK